MIATDRPALAIDIGGTQIKAGLITPAGELLALHRMETAAQSAPEAIVKKILAVGNELCREHSLGQAELSGLGISMAAFITAEGVITATAHLSRAWLGYDLRRRLEQEMPLPTYFALDTPAPTLGEAYFGAGRDVEDFVYITVSTGIGAGIMANRKYFTGGLGWAGGVGHIIIDERSELICEGCGNHGCLETYAAKQGILATARELIARFPASRLAALSIKDQVLTPRLVCEAALAGDPAAMEVFAHAGHALGIGLVNLANIVSPSRIVIGGGIALAGELLLGPARAVLTERAFPPQVRQVEIVPAALGDLSGIYGAAAMVFHDIRINPMKEIANL